MAHSASVSGSLLDDVFAVVSGVQCLILCCYNYIIIIIFYIIIIIIIIIIIRIVTELFSMSHLYYWPQLCHPLLAC